MSQSMPVPVKKTNGKPQPFAFFGDLEDDLQRLFRWPFAFTPTYLPTLTKTTAWAPRMDIFEKNGAIVVEAELPGLEKEDVHVEVQGTDLVISGESKAESEVKEEDYYRSERTFGSFYRRMPVPAGTTAQQITASLTDGVLQVTIPKPAPAPQPTRVEVK
jgi:HSP20 family protein